MAEAAAGAAAARAGGGGADFYRDRADSGHSASDDPLIAPQYDLRDIEESLGEGDVAWATGWQVSGRARSQRDGRDRGTVVAQGRGGGTGIVGGGRSVGGGRGTVEGGRSVGRASGHSERAQVAMQ